MSEKFPLGRVMFWAGLAIGVSVLQTSGNVDTTAKPDTSENVVYLQPDDPILADARKTAQRELPTFLKIAKADPLGWELAALKVSLPTQNSFEHIWVENFSRLQGQTYEGYLMNEPIDLQGLGIGDMVTFSFDQVDDFAFIEGGEGYGFYALRAMLPYMTPEQAAENGGFLSAEPLPDYW